MAFIGTDLPNSPVGSGNPSSLCSSSSVPVATQLKYLNIDIAMTTCSLERSFDIRGQLFLCMYNTVSNIWDDVQVS